jgi:dihydrofolate reductase
MPQGLKLIMVVSADGFVSRGPDDDMRWTGKDDKRVFRMLTQVGTGFLGAGRKTAALMPPLKGRTVVTLSHQLGHTTLGRFAHAYPGAWLIGGQTIALDALEHALVDEAYICHAHAHAFPYPGMDRSRAQVDAVTPFLENSPFWATADRLAFGDVTVDIWRRST